MVFVRMIHVKFHPPKCKFTSVSTSKHSVGILNSISGFFWLVYSYTKNVNLHYLQIRMGSSNVQIYRPCWIAWLNHYFASQKKPHGNMSFPMGFFPPFYGLLKGFCQDFHGFWGLFWGWYRLINNLNRSIFMYSSVLAEVQSRSVIWNCHRKLIFL